MGYTPPTNIDIGSDPTDREDSLASNTTWIDKNNPANETGIITSIEIWAETELENCEVAIFYVVSGNNLSTRIGGTVTLGTVTAGSKQTFTEDSESDPISLNVVAGDYIGIFYTAGTIERSFSGAGTWGAVGDYIPCINVAFAVNANRSISLYGTGGSETGILTIGDSFSVADSLIKNVTKQLGEAFSIADSFVKTIILYFYETFSVMDSFVRNVTKQLGETLSIVDSKIMSGIKYLGEAFSIVDSFAHTIILYFYETLKVTDSFIKHLRTFWHKVIKSVAVYTKVDLKEEIPWEEMTWKNLGDVTWLDIANMTWRDLSVEAISFYKKVIKKISTYEKVKK